MTNSRRFLTYFVLGYIVLALGWWVLLLNRTVNEIHEEKIDHLATTLLFTHQINDRAELAFEPDYERMISEQKRSKTMLLGESVFLLGSVLLGVYFVYRAMQQEVSAAKQQRNFLLSITHELKSPIAGIRLILETFQKRPELPAPMQQKLSTNALQETDRLTTLVNDLLLSAQLETRYQLNPEPLDLGNILQDTVEEVARKYPGSRISLDVEPDLPTVNGDRSGLTSVAINLIENAAKYSRPKPEIEVAISRNGPGEILWKVSDNGIGIPDEEKEKVWAKFYRVGSEDTRRTKGTGLGLYIVRKLVELHGGVIDLSDNEPKGSQFRISLPVKG